MEIFDLLPPFNRTKLSKDDVFKLKSLAVQTPIPENHPFYVRIMDTNILKNKNLDHIPHLRAFLLESPSFTMMLIILAVGVPNVNMEEYGTMVASRIDEVYKTKNIKTELSLVIGYINLARDKISIGTVHEFCCCWKRHYWLFKISNTAPLSTLRPFTAFVPIPIRVMALFLQRLHGTADIDFPVRLLPKTPKPLCEQVGVWEILCMMPSTLPTGSWPLYDEFVRRVGGQSLPALLATYFTGWDVLWKRHPDRWGRMRRKELALFRKDHPKLTNEETRILTNAVLSLAERDRVHRTCV